MVKDQLSILNHLKLNSHFLPLLVSCLMSMSHDVLTFWVALLSGWLWLFYDTRHEFKVAFSVGHQCSFLSPLIDCKLFWLDATLACDYHGDKAPDVETMGPCQWSVMMLRGQPPVRSPLTSVGLRRESRQSVVSWRSDSEDVTYSRSQPAKCNCAIMPWWQSVCETLPTICNKNRLS